tara:strand:+ start:526 stop:879 length:354 start_codon:yes stop_codon:yes gene_type:complete
MKLKKPIIPKPYIRIEIYRDKNDDTTENLMVEDSNLQEVREWSEDIIVSVVKSNIKKSLTIGKNTKIILTDWKVIDVEPTKYNNYTGKKTQKGKNITFRTIGVSPSKIANALKNDLK